MYGKRGKNGEDMVTFLYSNHLLLAWRNIESINCMKLGLAKTFEIMNLGTAKLFLGLEIGRHKYEQIVWPTQSKYAYSVLVMYGMDSWYGVNRLMEDC